MKVIQQSLKQLFKELVPSILNEILKLKRSRTLWMTVMVYLLIISIGGFFMYILKDPETARNLGLIGAKAQLLGGTADWPGYINLIILLESIGCLVISGFIFIWMFGREFGDHTVIDLLSLPTSRMTIVLAKTITAALWSLALVTGVFIVAIVLGLALQLPGWSNSFTLRGLSDILVTGILTVIISSTFALVASITRGYLAAVGAIFLVLMLGEVLSRLGYGQFFPWTVPMLYSGAAEALSGSPPTLLSPISYLLVVLTGMLSLISTVLWWRCADHT